MTAYGLEARTGFRVIHDGGNWRTALHSYDENVNSAACLTEWGIHEDSEEAFVLLCGAAVLAVRQENGQANVCRMEPFHQYVVGVAERHAIALREGAIVLIMENQDMSQFQTEVMDEACVAAVKAALE